MKQEFGLTGMTQWDSSTGATYVGVSISVPRVFHNPSPEWKQYLVECRKCLDRVAAQESIEIQEWSTNLTFEDGLTRITHHVFAYGELTGATPNLLQWALAPARDYETLDILARALDEGVLIESHLKRAAECNCPRYDHDGKLLPEAIPTLLLAMALSTPGWRGLVCPSDNPWAYIAVTIYGDATAEQRRTSASRTDWQIVKEFFGRHTDRFDVGFRVPSVNPPVKDRINCMNAKLRNQVGQYRLLVDRNCKHLIQDLEQVSWKADPYGNPLVALDKSDPKRTHVSDALGYLVAREFPMRAIRGERSGPMIC
jgi:hypothetical protein